MAKGFPYFKFTATEWLTGDIVFEDFELQGIFINLCALYWHRDGKITIEEVKKRLKTDRLTELNDRFFSVSDGFISISFLDEQLIEANHISKQNSINGKKGGRPKANTVVEEKPTANRPLTDRKAKKSKEEEEEEKEEELNKNNIKEREEKFIQSLRSFSNYSPEMIEKFISYWTEVNKSGTKMRFESEKFFDLSRRLKNWAGREKSFKPQNAKQTVQDRLDIYQQGKKMIQDEFGSQT